MKWAGLVLLAGCVTTPAPLPVVTDPVKPVVAPVDSQLALREVVNAFVAASEAKRFSDVHALLSRTLRERYSVETLARDFGTEPLAAERLSAIKSKSGDRLVESESGASLLWAPGRSLKLVREGESWKVSSLE